MDKSKAKDTMTETIRRIVNLNAAGSLLYWDFDTIMPKKGAEGRAEVMGAIQGEAFRLQTSPAFGEALEVLNADPEGLNEVERRMLEDAWFDYDRERRVPQELFEKATVNKAKANSAWKQAKEQNDFSQFEPLLQKNIDYTREIAECYGYADKPYDALLAAYDDELLTAQIDALFGRMREGIMEILARVPQNPAPAFPRVPAENQQQIGLYLLKEMGYDLDAGNLYTTEHPFSGTVHKGDVRVTTHYFEDMPQSSIFSVLHEGGHGMYEQRIDPALAPTGLMTGTTMGMHESQSRFWENIVGRRLAFWEPRLARVNELAGVELAASPEAFFRAVNHARPSLVRIEADELTYGLHIIIRYEIEKAIFNEGVNAKDLPELWRAKYQEYLGIAPETDSQGVMQDVHWAGAQFGYFPSYALGNLYGAQFLGAMEKQLGSLDSLVGTGAGLAQVAGWLTDNVYRYGRLLKPAEVLRRATGEVLSPEPFLAYIGEKMNRVYGL